MGPSKLIVLLKITAALELAMRKQQTINPTMTQNIFPRVMQKLPIMYNSGKIALVLCLSPNIYLFAEQNGNDCNIVSKQQYLVKYRKVQRCHKQKTLQQQALFFQHRPSIVLKVQGMQARMCPNTIVPIWRTIILKVRQRLSQQDYYFQAMRRGLQYQWIAIDWKKKSDRASRKPWVIRAQRITKDEVMIGLIKLSLRTKQMPSRVMFATNAEIDIRVKMKEKMNIQQFGQNAARAILRTGTILVNFDLFVNIVNIAARNPTINAKPIIKVYIDWLLAKFSCTLSGTNGILGPKNLIKKSTPAKSIKAKNNGMYRQVAMAGMVKLVMTRIRQIAATANSAKTMGIKAVIIATRGLAISVLLSRSVISCEVICTPPAENRTKNRTAAMRSRYRMQQIKSVQRRQGIGPLRH